MQFLKQGIALPLPPQIAHPRANPMALINAPLTLTKASIAAGDLKADINEMRRRSLAQKKHFLVRGTEWLDLAGIKVTDLHKSGYAHGVFTKMRTFGSDWAAFCDQWNFERGDGGSLGKNIVGEYLSNNQRDNDRYLSLRNVDTRYLTLYRAVGFVAFLHLFASSWFDDGSKGKGRRRKFQDTTGVEYTDDFVFERMVIEPVIYKIGTLGSAHNEELMGVDWRERGHDSIQLSPNPHYMAAFRDAIELPWTQSIDTADIVKGLFIEERCADLGFTARVAKFTGEFFNTAPPLVRSGSDFKGPSAGILYQRFIDIRTTATEPLPPLPQFAVNGETETKLAKPPPDSDPDPQSRLG